MLHVLMFSIRVTEWLPVWERAVHSVYCACLLRTFMNFCVCFFPFWLLVLDVGLHCIKS